MSRNHVHGVPTGSRSRAPPHVGANLTSSASSGNIKTLSESVLHSKSASFRDLIASSSRDLPTSRASESSLGSTAPPGDSSEKSHVVYSPDFHEMDTIGNNVSQASLDPSHNAGIRTSEHPYDLNTSHLNATVLPGSTSPSARARKRHISESRSSGTIHVSNSRQKASGVEYLELMAGDIWTRTQCLVVHDIASEVCSLPAWWKDGCPRTRKMRQIHLKFCGAFPLYHAIPLADKHCPFDQTSESECRQILNNVARRDQEASDKYCFFKNISSKFDCTEKYSTDWSCDSCKEAYRDWLCSHEIPYYQEKKLIEPCPRYCELVENRCPYIKPHLSESYAGEQTFICRDWDDIPRTYYLEDGEYEEPKSAIVECHEPCRNSPSSEICINKTENGQDITTLAPGDLAGDNTTLGISSGVSPARFSWITQAWCLLCIVLTYNCRITRACHTTGLT